VGVALSAGPTSSSLSVSGSYVIFGEDIWSVRSEEWQVAQYTG
jgi:hypothetical protein